MAKELVKDYAIRETGLNSAHQVIDINVRSNFKTRQEDYGNHTFLLDVESDMVKISEVINGNTEVLHIITAPYRLCFCDNICND